jgi:hypothetical protein
MREIEILIGRFGADRQSPRVVATDNSIVTISNSLDINLNHTIGINMNHVSQMLNNLIEFNLKHMELSRIIHRIQMNSIDQFESHIAQISMEFISNPKYSLFYQD